MDRRATHSNWPVASESRFPRDERRLVGAPVDGSACGLNIGGRRGDEAGLNLRADFIERLGSSVNIHLHRGYPDAPALVWHHVEPARVARRRDVRLVPDPAHLHLFDPDGRAIARLNRSAATSVTKIVTCGSPM